LWRAARFAPGASIEPMDWHPESGKFAGLVNDDGAEWGHRPRVHRNSSAPRSMVTRLGGFASHAMRAPPLD